MRKLLRNLLVKQPLEDRRILFIVGCQRSGTTLLGKGVFSYDLSSRIYKERSTVSDENLRLLPLPEVAAEWRKTGAGLIVCKPLNDSQIIDHLLDYFPDARAVWMFRNYRDVAFSNLETWGPRNGINDLRPVVEADSNNWRAERNSDEMKALIREKFSEEMNPYDAAALFWLMRNTLFLDLKLEHHPRVMLCAYEDLVTKPDSTVGGIYDFINKDFPGTQILREIHRNSTGRGQGIELSDDVESLCRGLWERLLMIKQNQNISRRVSQEGSS